MVFVSALCATYIKLRHRPQASNQENNRALNLLENTTWTWSKNEDSQGQALIPNDSTRFKIRFEKDKFYSSTDCNGVSGSYVIVGNSIKFSEMMSTMMYCENSDEHLYVASLGDAVYYKVNNKKLIINLLNESGLMMFDRVN